MVYEASLNPALPRPCLEQQRLIAQAVIMPYMHNWGKDDRVDRGVVVTVEHKKVGMAWTRMTGQAYALKYLGGAVPEVGLAVDRRHRRQGVGRTALEGLLDQSRRAGLGQLFLKVYQTNSGAQKLYEQLGFTHQAVHPVPHNPLENLNIMSIELQG